MGGIGDMNRFTPSKPVHDTGSLLSAPWQYTNPDIFCQRPVGDRVSAPVVASRLSEELLQNGWDFGFPLGPIVCDVLLPPAQEDYPTPREL